MQRNKITNSAINALIFFMMITFVISAVFPDYSLEKPTVNMEEADMDGQESSEEKKENKEEKESFHEDFSNAITLQIELRDKSNQISNTLILQELYLPVITPPPDLINPGC